MNNFSSQISQLEIQEARKRMGTFGGANAGTGFQNTSGNTTMTSGNMPSLNDSKSVDNLEVQKVKQDMNKTGMY